MLNRFDDSVRWLRSDVNPDIDRDTERGLVAHLQQHIEQPGPTAPVIGLFAIRLRGLERITHGYGWAVANRLRRAIGDRLQAALGPGELLTYTDDRTFFIASPVGDGTTNAADGWLSARARDLLAVLGAQDFDLDGVPYKPAIGVGIARSPRDGRDALELMAIADEAAHRSSKRRLKRISWPDYAARAHERERVSLEQRLRHAVDEGQLSVHYQPIIELDSPTRRVVGAEALVRWPQPEGHQAIGPAHFIPLAEELGLIQSIGELVLETACQQLRRWQDQLGTGDFWVAVNLAPAQLQDTSLAMRFTEIAKAAGVAPSAIKLEVTESAFEADVEDVTGVIQELIAAGFPLAVDDFGTGHSSVSRLISLPFEVLKVDASLVQQGPDGAGAPIVSGLSRLADELHLACVGEGVETGEQEAFLRACGYAYAQGYRYGAAVPASAFTLPEPASTAVSQSA